MNTVKIVIGSWGSYNSCNERAHGSNWLDLSDYSDWDEILDELKAEGFQLDGIDEELFIQDIEGISCESANWDSINPQTLFDALNDSDVLYNENKFEIMEAYLEVRSLQDFFDLVDSDGDRWDDDIYIYPDKGWDDYGRELFEDYEGRPIDDVLDNFFDFEAYGEYIGEDFAEEYSNGIIEIR
jgi:hypothetical protein